MNGVEGGNANVGTIALSGDNINVVYHAPANPPANNPVTITTELTEFKAWDFVNKKKKSFNKVILFKRVRIGSEYNFHVKMEVNNNDLACDSEQTYQDEAEMDVHVKDGVVTVSNIVNQDAVITPRVLTTNNCTLTCSGGVGQLNVVSGEGRVVDTSAERYLFLTMNVAGAVGPGSKLECGTGETSTAQPHVPDQGFIAFFVLKDSAQTKDLIFKWTLTPE